MMRALLRILSLIYKDQQKLPIPSEVIMTLEGALNRANKNPSDPTYNHYMFENIAAAVRINIKNENLGDFQTKFFPIFVYILENAITDFVPYVFQVLSLVLENMKEGALDSDPNLVNIFNGAILPAAWESTGNIPPLSRLIGAFISRKDARQLILSKLQNILGIFKKLINSKANDHHAFFIVNCLCSYVEIGELEKYLPSVMRLIFTRIRTKKTNKVIRGLLLFLSTMMLNYSIDQTIDIVEKVQPGIWWWVGSVIVIFEVQNLNQ